MSIIKYKISDKFKIETDETIEGFVHYCRTCQKFTKYSEPTPAIVCKCGNLSIPLTIESVNYLLIKSIIATIEDHIDTLINTLNITKLQAKMKDKILACISTYGNYNNSNIEIKIDVPRPKYTFFKYIKNFIQNNWRDNIGYVCVEIKTETTLIRIRCIKNKNSKWESHTNVSQISE